MSDTTLTIETLTDLPKVHSRLHREVEIAHRCGDGWAKAEAQGRLDLFETSMAELGCFLIRRALERTPEMLVHALEGSFTIARLITQLERAEQRLTKLAERIGEVEDHIVAQAREES